LAVYDGSNEIKYLENYLLTDKNILFDYNLRRRYCRDNEKEKLFYMAVTGEYFYNGGIYYNKKWVMDNYYYQTTKDFINNSVEFEKTSYLNI
jgi:hypothetical protein